MNYQTFGSTMHEKTKKYYFLGSNVLMTAINQICTAVEGFL